MANNWENSNQVLQAICPTNALKLDDMNQPSVMVFIPAFRLCDVLSTSDTSIHPAFRRNGVQKDGFWFGKFESKMYNGRAYSRPNEDPTVSMNQDQFVAQTKSKGEGWHEATNAEWAAIALWCHKTAANPTAITTMARTPAKPPTRPARPATTAARPAVWRPAPAP